MIKRILTVGGYTLASRATGFLRDIMLAAFLGAGPVADAFFIAFVCPTIFARFLPKARLTPPSFRLMRESARKAGRRRRPCSAIVSSRC